jgi:hypothetical protein
MEIMVEGVSSFALQKIIQVKFSILILSKFF